MNTALQEFNDRLAMRGTSRNTIATYDKILVYYFAHAAGDESPEKVNLFLQKERESGKAVSSLRSYYYAIKAMWKVYGLEWSDTIVLPKRSEDEEEEDHGKCFESKDMFTMIDYCKGLLVAQDFSRLTPNEIARFALGSVYGFRVSEIAEVSSSNFADGVLSVKSKKHGKRRVHSIPDELSWVPGLINGPAPLRSTSLVMKRIMSLCDLTGPQWNRFGFHSMRSAVVTMLTGQIGVVDVILFMGWKTPPGFGTGMGALQMVSRYSRPEVEALNTRVYRVHKFLERWR